MHGMIISKALGLQSGSQVVHNNSVPKFVYGTIGDVTGLLSQTGI